MKFDLLDKVRLLAIGGVLCVAGAASVSFDVFPGRQVASTIDRIRHAREIEAFAETDLGKLDYRFIVAKQDRLPPIPCDDCQAGAVFVVGYQGAAWGATLVDQVTGEVLHRWQITRAAAMEGVSEFRPYDFPDERFWIHGAQVLPDGGMLASFEGGEVWGSGLVRLDAASKPVWFAPIASHHDVEVSPIDGTIWVPTMRWHPDPSDQIYNLRGPVIESTVTQVDMSTGKVLASFSVPEMLMKSRFKYLLAPTMTADTMVSTTDVMHLNAVDIVTEAFASHYPELQEGDISLSLRNLHAIVFFRPSTSEVVKVVRGPFVLQHDPDLLDNGNIMVFDNFGADLAKRLARIIEIDPRQDNQVVWSWSGEGPQGFSHLYTGKIDLSPDGQKVMVSDRYRGRAFEIDRKTGKIDWSWRNDGSDGQTYAVNQASYVSDAIAATVSGVPLP